jgi:S-adenosylmethionine hydrolase
LKGSVESYTFHGRDVYAYTGARLASHSITFEQVGKVLEGDIVRLPDMIATITGDLVNGNIPVLDIQYGNVWTNIDKAALEKIGVVGQDSLKVEIYFNDEKKFDDVILLGNTFSDVPVGSEVAYMNSLLNLSFGVNQGSFAERYGIKSGAGWKVVVQKKN